MLFKLEIKKPQQTQFTSKKEKYEQEQKAPLYVKLSD